MKKEYLIIIALVVVIILLSTCGRNNKVQTKEVKVYRTDSIYFHTIDTFIKTIHSPIKYLTATDTVYLYGRNNTYIYSKTDSLIDYKITVTSSCYPDSVGIEYDIKQFTIYDSVNVYIRDSVYQEGVIRSYTSFGATVLGSKESFGFVPQMVYNHKSGSSIGLGYDLINSNVHLTFVKKISFRKK